MQKNGTMKSFFYEKHVIKLRHLRRAGHVAHVGNEINAWSLYSLFWAMKMEQRIPKRQHIKFRGRGTTQKKEHSDNLKSGKYMVLCEKEWRRGNICQTKRRWKNNVKLIIGKWDWAVWTVLIWLMSLISGEFLWAWQWTFCFYKMHGIYW